MGVFGYEGFFGNLINDLFIPMLMSSDGDERERERYWEESHCKASFSSSYSISVEALHGFCN